MARIARCVCTFESISSIKHVMVTNAVCAHIRIPTRKECDVPNLPTYFEGIEVRAYLILLSLALFSPLWHRKTFLLHVAKTITSSM